jgi:hypothetical protein
MDYSDYIRWKANLSTYTGGICPADCIAGLGNGGSNTSGLPAGKYFSDYLFYNNLKSSWQVGSNSVHIGSGAGASGIGYSSIAIGDSANAKNNFSIAIGKSTNLGGTNTIALNATGNSFSTDQNNSFFVTPVRQASRINVLYYDPNTKEVSYGLAPAGSSGPSLPTGSQQGEYLYYNGLTWAIGSDKISIGAGAGSTEQSTGAVAIGKDAGSTSQGSNAIAIGTGAGKAGQHSNTIILNATGSEMNSEGAGRLYVKPIREADANKALYYNAVTGEVSYYAPYDGSDIDDASRWALFKAKQVVDMSGYRIEGLGVPVADTDAVTKGYLMAQLRDASDALPLGGGTMLGAIDMSGKRVLNVGSAVTAGDAVNKGYVDGTFLKLQGGVMRGDIDMSGYMMRIQSDPSGDTDVVNKRYLWSQLRDVSDALPLGGGTMLGDIDMSGRRILRIAEPSVPADVATKNYVDTRVPLGSSYGEYIYHDGVKWAVGGTSVNLGLGAGVSEMGDDTVAIGRDAGSAGQGDYAVAIGARAGLSGQADKSIVINATGVELRADLSGAFYVKPVREQIGQKVMYYDAGSGELTYGDISGGTGEANGGRIGTNTLNNNTYKFRRYPYGLNINDGKTVADGEATEQDTIANAFAKVDEWIHNYLIAQPQAPVQLPLTKVATPTSVYFAFQNPVQIKTAVFEQKLPLIEHVNVDICNNNVLYNALTLNTTYVPGINEINAFVITNVPIIPPYRQISLSVSGEATPRLFNAYYYYNGGIISSQNLIKFWYSNYSELPPNILTAMLPGFAEGTAPSIPINLRFTNIRQNGFEADWDQPQYSDTGNSIYSTDFDSPLLFYKLKYEPVDTIRYPGIYSATPYAIGNIIPTELTLPYSSSIDAVYPGTKYLVEVGAFNNTKPTLSGPEISGNLVTIYPAGPAGIITNTFSFTKNYNYTPGTDTIKQIFNNQNVNYPIIKDYVDISSSVINGIGVHKYTGVFATDKNINTGLNIMSLNGSYQNNSVGNVNFNNLSFNGYGQLSSPQSSGTASEVELKATDCAEYISSPSYSQGFYLTTNAHVLVKNLSASMNPYKIIVSQFQNNIAQGSIETNIYLDDISNVPIISSSILDYNETNFIKISGVSILNTPININSITDVDNIASYYYVAKDLIKYTLYDDGAHILFSKIINDISEGSNYSIGYPTIKNYNLLFNNVNINMNFTNVFTKQIFLRMVARNLIGYSQEYTINKKIIIDTESVTNVALYNSNTIPSINNIYKSGRLNTSDLSGVFNLDEFSYFRNKYDMSMDICLNKTLQIYRGKFSPRAYTNNNAYIDYNFSEYNSGINYSQIPLHEYRYATFAWKIDANASYSSILFKIKGVTGEVPLIYNDKLLLNSVNKNLHFYYRFENINNPDNISPNVGTVWIDGNSYDQKDYNGELLFFNSINTDISYNGILGGRYNDLSLRYENNEVNYNVLIPIGLTSTYVYATIGVPNDSQFIFTAIEASIN